MFLEKKCLFSFGLLCAARSFATDTSLHYGILPLPKYHVTQEYATTPQDGYSVFAIPLFIGDRLDIATATLDMLSYWSYQIVRPIYYDVAYKVRYASSEQTSQLFDTVIDSVVFTFGRFYSNSIGDPVHLMRNRLIGSGNKPSSSLAGLTVSYTALIELKLQELLGKFDSISTI